MAPLPPQPKPAPPAPASTATPIITTLEDAALETLLPTAGAAMLLLSGLDGPRSDARTEFEKASAEHGRRIQFIRVDTRTNPIAAERFEVERHPVVVSWANGALLGRRNRPWGTDIKGMVDELLKVAPTAPLGTQEIVRMVKKPIKVTDETFQTDVIDADLPTVVDFWAEWCGPCKKIAPVLEKLAVDYAGRLVIAKLNTDENPGVSQYFRIESIPTLMFIKNKKIYNQQAGAYPESTLRQLFDQFLAMG